MRPGRPDQAATRAGVIVHVLALGVCVLTSVKKLGKIKAILEKG
jgi:hypothetical protein